jgi:hypothetical protein
MQDQKEFIVVSHKATRGVQIASSYGTYEEAEAETNTLYAYYRKLYAHGLAASGVAFLVIHKSKLVKYIAAKSAFEREAEKIYQAGSY